MLKKIIPYVKTHTVFYIEFMILLIIGCGLLAYIISSVFVLSSMDWGDSATMAELIQRALLMMIGLEVIQVVRVHSLKEVFLVSVFILARKSLDPTNSSLDIIFLLFSLVLVVGLWGYLLRQNISINKETA